MNSIESPIGPLDSIDAMGVRNDGGIDTVIVCPGSLDSSENTLESLQIKVRNYLQEISSQNFIAQFGSGPVKIFIACEYEISTRARNLIEELAHEAARKRVLLVLGSPVA